MYYPQFLFRNQENEPIKGSIIGVTGVARSGKDTFYEIFKDIVDKRPQKDIVVFRLSIADFIRRSVHESIKSFTSQPIEDIDKEVLRPLYAQFGKIVRDLTCGEGFTIKLSHKIQNIINFIDPTKNVVFIITDIRFDEYDFDEVRWLTSYNGILIHITRYTNDPVNGTIEYIKPVNELERINDPILKDQAHYYVEWETANNLTDLYPAVRPYVQLVEDAFDNF